MMSLSHEYTIDQKGSAIVTSLLLLVVLTLLAVTALDSTVMEERMSNNTRQRIIAQQAAETALKQAETILRDNIKQLSHLNQFDGSKEIDDPDNPGEKIIPHLGLYDSTKSGSALTWNTNNAANWSGSTSAATSVIVDAVTDPRFVIEYLGRAGDPPLNFKDPDLRQYAFRITSIGWGLDSKTKVVLSSTFHKRLL